MDMGAFGTPEGGDVSFLMFRFQKAGSSKLSAAAL